MARKRGYNLIFHVESEEDIKVRRSRWIREKQDYFNNLGDKDSKIRFCLSKFNTLLVIDIYKKNIDYHNRLICTPCITNWST